MTSVEDPNRFSLPVETAIVELLQAKFPGINVSRGSAIYDILVLPMSLMFQTFRDYSKVIARNQSLANYATMLPEELDRLAANYGVFRNSGTKARGTQRITFKEPKTVVVPTTAVFSTDDGLRFVPVSSTTFRETVVAGNFITSTGEYYVDVSVEAEQVGSAYSVQAGAVRSVSGVSGALRTFNVTDMTVAQDAEGNSQLYARIRSSISNRDLVKSTGIIGAIRDAFPSVTQVRVVGAGDPAMTRDTVTVSLSQHRLFEQSFCQKVNLPLNSSGQVQWEDSSGAAVQGPLGGFVGAIYDLLSLDYNAIPVQVDGINTELVSAQQNFKVRLLNPEDPDAFEEYTVTRVEEVPVIAGGPLVKILRLDRPFSDTTLVDVEQDIAVNPYTVFGFFSSNTFHVGGKVDVYVASSNIDQREVIVTSLPALSETQPNASEVPITASFVDVIGEELFERNIGFTTPVLSIDKVEEVDPIDANVVLKTLVPGTDYSFIRASARSRFTEAEFDVLSIRGTKVDFITQVEEPAFVGSRIKITYSTSPDILAIQQFLSDDVRRDITKDLKVMTFDTVRLSVELNYKGSISEEDVAAIITEYIKLKQDNTVTVQELISALQRFDVVDVLLPVTLRAKALNPDGTFTAKESTDRLTLSSAQIFVADSEQVITKVEQ